MRSEEWWCAAQFIKRREFLKNACTCFLIAWSFELGAGELAPKARIPLIWNETVWRVIASVILEVFC